MVWFIKKKIFNADPRGRLSDNDLKKSFITPKDIKILGSGCARCRKLEIATKEALSRLDLKLDVDHVFDFAQIASYGVMSTPALVIDGKVVSCGKTLTADQVLEILKK